MPYALDDRYGKVLQPERFPLAKYLSFIKLGFRPGLKLLLYRSAEFSFRFTGRDRGKP